MGLLQIGGTAVSFKEEVGSVYRGREGVCRRGGEGGLDNFLSRG